MMILDDNLIFLIIITSLSLAVVYLVIKNLEYAKNVVTYQEKLKTDNEKIQDLTHEIETLRDKSLKDAQKLTSFEEKSNLGQHLNKIHEKLGILDNLTSNINTLHNIFSSKQLRGNFGENKLADILADELAATQYSSQYTLSNSTRPDFVIHLPKESKVIAVDAKFPLENYSLIQNAIEAKSADKIELARKAFIADLKKHIKDISQKYIEPKDTMEMAILFIPAETIFGYIAEHCQELQSFAAQNNVILSSPNTLMLIVRIIKSLFRDRQIQENAKMLQQEILQIARYTESISELSTKLQKHLGQCNGDLDKLIKASEKLNSIKDKVENINLGSPQPKIEYQSIA